MGIRLTASSDTTKTTMLRRALAGAAAAATAAAVLIAPAAVAAVPAIDAPGNLKVTRSGADLNQLDITWKAVPGADHYVVNVFDGSKDQSFTVAGDQTSRSVAVSGACAQYSVVVTAYDDVGGSAKTNTYRVERLAPGGITKVEASRTATSARLSWQPPASVGAAPIDGYRVLVKQLSNGKTLVDRDSGNASESLDGLEGDRVYVAKITPHNKYGGCFTSSVLLQGRKPTEPRGLTAVRAPGNPDQVQLSWTAPIWSGFGRIERYEVGYRAPTSRRPTWDPVGSGLSHNLILDSTKTWSVWVRVVSSDGATATSKELRINPAGQALTPEVDPKIGIVESNGVVVVDFDSAVGSSSKYPNMKVAIAPTLGGKGFRANHEVSNGAGQVVFDRVPCGVFSVVVTGQGPKDTKEFGRQVLNRCDTGAIPATQWKLVYGRADISGNNVSMTYGNEARVMSTTKRSSQDMVFTTNADLRSGWGYGIWTRASLSNGASPTGYSFQYDPGYENVNKSFGKALLLRVWNQGKECGNPVAKVKWPSGMTVNGPHLVTVIAQGDSMYASIDGIKLFDVSSLKDAMTSSGCRSSGYKEPTGSEVGFRTWSSTGAAVFSGTTLN
ncbi:MAG: fibronectin type III domain-containing protein [Candidatus Nanopelagicales bacterium]